MAWTVLIAAGLLEIVWAAALKHSDGFSRPGATAIGVIAATVSFALLTWALKHLPVGTAYAVWVGIGVLGVTLAGALVFGEPWSAAKVVCLALILTGVVGLHAIEPSC